jgi:chaperonin cofactor prefoldin
VEREKELKDLEDRFAMIENRVKMLVTRNKDLKNRIRELDQELAQVRRDVQNVEYFHGKKLHIKEKIERILQTLENA